MFVKLFTFKMNLSLEFIMFHDIGIAKIYVSACACGFPKV